MSSQEPTTETLNTTDARRDFSQLLNQVRRREKRIIVENSGIPVAAIVSMADLARLQQIEERYRRNIAVLEDIWAHFKDVPVEEHEREVAKAVAEASAEILAERERARAAQ